MRTTGALSNSGSDATSGPLKLNVQPVKAAIVHDSSKMRAMRLIRTPVQSTRPTRECRLPTGAKSTGLRADLANLLHTHRNTIEFVWNALFWGQIIFIDF